MGLIVIDPGLSTTVQDAGRPGYREWGVPLGGAFDRGSADLANALLGNSHGCAVLELTLAGGIYQADGPLALVAGRRADAGEGPLAPNSAEQSLQSPSSFSLRDGQRLMLGPDARRSQDLPGGQRGMANARNPWQPLVGTTRSGQAMSCRPSQRRSSRAAPASQLGDPPPPTRFASSMDPTADRIWSLTIPLGRSPVSRRLAQRPRWACGSAGEPLTVPSPPERLSSPVAPGAIQVAGGQLIVLGVACGTMGGYPHVAHVISADLDRLGQLKPGDVVHFRRLTIEEAPRADQTARQARRTLLSRIVALAADAGE